jgi:hypothetical protein
MVLWLEGHCDVLKKFANFAFSSVDLVAVRRVSQAGAAFHVVFDLSAAHGLPCR